MTFLGKFSSRLKHRVSVGTLQTLTMSGVFGGLAHFGITLEAAIVAGLSAAAGPFIGAAWSAWLPDLWQKPEEPPPP